MSARIDALAKSVALQRTRERVVRAAVDAGRSLPGCDAAFAAVPEDGGFRIAVSSGIRDARFHEVLVRPARGLGGQVLMCRRPMRVADYARDRRITRDYVAAVRGERLRGVACVPVAGPGGLEALLYAGAHAPGALGDRAVEQLERIAGYAEVGLCEIAGRERELELERLRERQRIASRLHDSVAQLLFAIGVSASAASTGGDPAALRAALREIERGAAQARRELRATLHELGRGPDALAFDARLEGELRLLERTLRCTVRVVRRGEARVLPEPVEQLLLDASLEGVRNAVKHAGARLTLVCVSYASHGVMLAIQTEIAAGARWPALAGTGAGVALLRARAQRLRGTLELDAGADGLRVLRLELPCAP